MNEAETRAEHIDPALGAAGRGAVEAAASGANIRSAGADRRPRERRSGHLPHAGRTLARTFAEANAWRDRFAAVPLGKPAGKSAYYFQEIAITRVMEAIAEDRSRILLTLATGTGKDVHRLSDRLEAPTRRPRILFLADRNILANQAFNAFSAFPEDALVRIDPANTSPRRTEFSR
ncbi:MAG: DEAD/DEAH box helicase family protein [Verrucomicrobiota bacterium]|nr:DEAD/DEAH box helicase family protein [Verrucomicrobiota bacterium]